MNISITHKIFLAMLTAAGLAVVSSVMIMQWSVNRGFLRFVNSMEQSGMSRLAQALEESYRTDHSWELLRREPARWRQLISTTSPGSPLPPAEPPAEALKPFQPSHSEKTGPMPPHLRHHFNERLYLLTADRKQLAGSTGERAAETELSLTSEGKVIGYLGLLPRTAVSEAPQQRFLKEQRLAFVLTAAVVVLVAGLLSLLLARRLVRPLQEVAQATHQLASGSFSVRVPVTSRDAIGRLAGDFNSLAATLELSEQTRRQWVADISHELRTPIAILRSELEALQDGIRQPTPDTVHSLHGEILRLGRLVDDLYQLSLSDVGALSYRKRELDLAAVLRHSISRHRPEFSTRGIQLETIVQEGETGVFGDPERLHQLFSNLLDNAGKYTDAGGNIRIELQRHDGRVTVDFQDSAPGVQPEELERLFDRLYRVDTSRNRATGGAGLGLAICRTIVEAHGGRITARQSPLGGVWVRIELPKAGC